MMIILIATSDGGDIFMLEVCERVILVRSTFHPIYCLFLSCVNICLFIF